MGSLPKHRHFPAQSVCIIGAGPSGLAAAKYLLAEQTFARIVILEQRSTVGGVWNYVPCEAGVSTNLPVPQTDPNPQSSKEAHQPNGKASLSGREGQVDPFLTPLYDRLETNIPRGLMGFSDLNWPQNSQLFPKHETVLEYIEKYSQEIQKLIKFDTQVTDVRKSEDSKWIVQTSPIPQDRQQSPQHETFDAVIAATGHYDVPCIPSVPEIDAWNQAHPGRISHSKFYRQPEIYAGKKVIVVGNSASGIDIATQIEQVCQQPLLLSSRSQSQFVSEPSPSKSEKPQITEFLPEQRGVRFADGSVETDIDAILYCTGYFYSFPFLRSLDPPVITTGERVENTYQHIFYRPNPTLSFLVLNHKVIPFPVAEAQAAIIARVLSGRLALPSDEEMANWEADLVASVARPRDFHLLKFPKDADYINMLHDWAASVDDAEVNGSARTIGKEPPVWKEKEYWTRERFAMIKKTFHDLGEDRHKARTPEDVGYDFEQWQKEKQIGPEPSLKC